MLTVKPLERKAVYSVGPLILVVGTTYAMGLLVLVVGTTYSVGPLVTCSCDHLFWGLIVLVVVTTYLVGPHLVRPHMCCGSYEQ